MGLNFVFLLTLSLIDTTPAPVRTAIRIQTGLQPVSAALEVCNPPVGFQPIRTAGELSLISDNLNTNYFLCNDINMNGQNFLPLGGDSCQGEFTGIFEGNGKTISNLSIPYDSSPFSPNNTCVALFKNNTGNIRNFTLASPLIEGNYYTTGAIVGSNSGLVENVKVTGGSVWGPESVGGVVGTNYGVLRRSSVSGTAITASNRYAGGLTSFNDGKIEKSFVSLVNINSGRSAGGIVAGGNSSSSQLISDCYSSGTLTVTSGSAGGVAGFDNQGNYKNIYSRMQISSPAISTAHSFIGGTGIFAPIVASYYNSQINPTLSQNGGTPQTTAQMTAVPTGIYSGWDFTSVWQQTNGAYPSLRPLPNCANGACGATQFTITVNPTLNGSISPSTAQVVNAGASQVFTITPAPGFYIKSILVSGAAVAGTSSYTFTNIAENQTISAIFAPVYTLNVTSSSGGTVSPTGVLSMKSGSSQNFIIAPNVGYEIADFIMDGVSIPIGWESYYTYGLYTLNNINSNHRIEVSFSPHPKCIGDINGNGTVDDSDLGMFARHWQKNVTANTQGDFNGDGFVDIRDLSVFASHYGSCPTSFTINASTTGDYSANGSISPSGNISVSAGGSRTFTITPNAGYQIASVLVNGEFIGNPTTYTFSNIAADKTIVAYFMPN